MLKLIQVSKSFPGVRVLKNISLEVRKNEVVGLIGENGAGKSTLMKILTGVYQPDEGHLELDGRAIVLDGPRGATAQGIAMVHQEQSILPNLSVAENLFMGREDEFSRFGRLDWKRLCGAARQQLAKVHLDIDPLTKCSELSFGQRQMIELAKALALEERTDGHLVIMLDEPTSVLEQREIDILFRLVRELRSRASFIFVSHRLDELLELSDRLYVMKDGEVVAEMAAAEASKERLHSLMVGRSLHAEYYRESLQAPCSSEVALAVDGLSLDRHFRDVSFALHRGEVLGIAGVIGSGREELCRVIAGLLAPTCGTIEVAGRRLKGRGPGEAIAAGIGYIPRERKVEGIVLMMSVAENMTLARIGQVTTLGLLDEGREARFAEDWIKRLSIKTPGPGALCQNLSGGNQQKVVLAKWRNAGSTILVLDHPTRGLDVGAKEDVYQLIREITAEGVSVLLTADTLEEMIGLSHRILVMRDGEVAQSFDCMPGAKPEQVDLIQYMV
ncbi:sugar ABC transporter ATP-binding protein [Pseudomonas daroniae]|uniref:Sugar ABC transporter ATP-binding protein n=1 Tax=Phytopseudomonas daroniae TaxID=2487519 RepID=A0A4Q9QGU7_9GAMM|nr:MULTISPECIES: sugar ABC transporter ATP-binding protein [Pseudomonas]TBU73416.1 sugar ABC transporter ATP-binding protein [Pseudomonas daroniae]TBU79168.1 sugar ABC transporter ATP-binding protein [Pseudomonas sp. FRB 228]TBU88066.1 sugar ABC transporter ATP-binding protein [Pseudomonas daroniae]